MVKKPGYEVGQNSQVGFATAVPITTISSGQLFVSSRKPEIGVRHSSFLSIRKRNPFYKRNREVTDLYKFSLKMINFIVL